MKYYFLALTFNPALATFSSVAAQQHEETRKRLFSKVSKSVEQLSKQAHKELRLQNRAKWWAAHPERHPHVKPLG